MPKHPGKKKKEFKDLSEFARHAHKKKGAIQRIKDVFFRDPDKRERTGEQVGEQPKTKKKVMRLGDQRAQRREIQRLQDEQAADEKRQAERAAKAKRKRESK